MSRKINKVIILYAVMNLLVKYIIAPIAGIFHTRFQSAVPA
jgi:hypothetical protein